MRLVTFLVITYLCGELRRAREREASRDWADPVTGVGSHRLFHEVASAELARVQRTRRPFSLAYLDIDGLRGVNERLGYRAGDALLALVARTLDRDGRKADTCARIGGDELVLLMPETDPGGARTALQRILSVLSEIFREDGWPVTLSVGVVTFTEPPPGVDEMLRAAESCMYAAKRAGKNRVEFTEWDEAAPAAEVERSEQPDGAARDR
ncbi:MAG: GGDEF domain-containing protein [Armatimonadetes bacterium]|nr:GGDEF domain-containing protein [Armatimonadota bacterium]